MASRRPIRWQTQVVGYVALGTMAVGFGVVSYFGIDSRYPVRTSDQIGGIVFVLAGIAAYQFAYSRYAIARRRPAQLAGGEGSDTPQPVNHRGVIAGLLIAFGGVVILRSGAELGGNDEALALLGLLIGFVALSGGLVLVRSVRRR